MWQKCRNENAHHIPLKGPFHPKHLNHNERLLYCVRWTIYHIRKQSGDDHVKWCPLRASVGSFPVHVETQRIDHISQGPYRRHRSGYQDRTSYQMSWDWTGDVKWNISSLLKIKMKYNFLHFDSLASVVFLVFCPAQWDAITNRCRLHHFSLNFKMYSLANVIQGIRWLDVGCINGSKKSSMMFTSGYGVVQRIQKAF